MKKLQFGKDALILAILTLITVLTWLGLEVYWTLTKTEIPRILQEQMAPLNPKIATATLEELQQRVSFTQEELGEVTIPTPEEEKSVEEELMEKEELMEEVATEGGIVATEGGTLED